MRSSFIRLGTVPQSAPSRHTCFKTSLHICAEFSPNSSLTLGLDFFFFLPFFFAFFFLKSAYPLIRLLKNPRQQQQHRHPRLPVANIPPGTARLRSNPCRAQSGVPGRCCTLGEHPCLKLQQQSQCWLPKIQMPPLCAGVAGCVRGGVNLCSQFPSPPPLPPEMKKKKKKKKLYI